MIKSAKLLALLCLLFTLGMGCGGSSENFVFTNTSNANAGTTQGQLVFLNNPQRDAGQSFGAIQVAVQDFNGQLLSNAEIPILIELVDPQGATLSGTTTRTSVGGIAVFDDLSVDRVGNYEFRASSPGFESEDSTSFVITPAEPESLRFTQQPTTSTVDTPLAAVQVELLDNFGNRTDGNITIALANNPGSATLSGTLTSATTNGLASFDDLELSAAGTGYTFEVSSGTLSTTQSNPFDIVAPAPRLIVGGPDYISFFDASANGNTAPLRTIQGNAADVGVPCGFWLEGNELFVADCQTDMGVPAGKVSVYASGASGDTPPLRSLQGSNTLLRTPNDVLVFNDELFVADRLTGGDGVILVFPVGASGNVTPTRMISGGNSLLSSPDSLATDGTNLFVADQIADNDPRGGVLVFPFNADGNVAPAQAIRGVNTTLNGPFGLAVSSSEIFVTDVRADNSIKVFPLAGDGGVAPNRALNVTPTAGRLALNGTDLYLTDPLNDTIHVYNSGDSGSDPAIRTLSGANTGLTNLLGVFVGIAP